MKILRVSMLASLALTAGARAWAQSPAVAPAPEARQMQTTISSSNRARIELCRKKGHVSLKPGEPKPPLFEEGKGAFTRPTPIYQVPPRYKGSLGTLVVEALIDEDGCVRQTRIVESKTEDRGLDDAALKALEQWVFLPATQGGRPIQVFYDVTFNLRTSY